MGRFNCCHLDLHGANRAALQLPDTHGVDRQFASGDDAAGKLTGADYVAFHCIRHVAKRHLGVLLRQAVVGVLRHPHGHPHSDAGSNDPDGIAKIDVLQEAVFPVFLGIRAVDEVHAQRDSRCIAACVKLSLCLGAHLRIALFPGFLVIAISLFLGFRHGKMNPFRMGIAADERAVQKELRQVQHIAVRVLARGHDPGNHVRQVDVVADAQQVFGLPDLHVAVLTDALHHIHVPPVAGQFSGVLFDHTAFTQQGVHGIAVFKLHILGLAVQVGIEGEVVLRQAGGRNGLHDRSPHRRG